MTDLMLFSQTTDVTRLLGGLGLILLFLPYTATALRFRSGPSLSDYRSNALAATMMLPAAWIDFSPWAVLVPGAWLALSVAAMVLRRPQPAGRLTPATMPLDALTQRPQPLPVMGQGKGLKSETRAVGV